MKIIKNYIYNTLYRILILLLPLITVPYISRTLGAEGIGVNAYTFSVIQYFVLIATLGLDTYSVREISKIRDDKEQLSKKFFEIFYLRIITVIVAYSSFLVFILFFNDDYVKLYWIQSLYIIMVIFDLSWFFMGLEDFKKMVLRNIFTKIIGILAIFIFVKEHDDLIIYIIILVLSQLAGQLTVWPYLKQYISLIKINKKNILKHLKPTLILFIPQISIQFYAVFNRVILGIFSDKAELGIFDNSYKIITMSLALISSIGTVMLPRISYMFEKENHEEIKKYLNLTLGITLLIAIGMIFGLLGIADNFALWFLGSEFIKAGAVISALTPSLLFITWGIIIGNQYLLPLNKMRTYTLAVSIGAITSVISNLIFIPIYSSVGAAISTSLAEFAVMVTMLIAVRSKIDFKTKLKELPLYLISGIVMYYCLLIISNLNINKPIVTMIQILIGFTIYLLVLILLKSQTIYYLMEMVKKLLAKKRKSPN